MDNILIASAIAGLATAVGAGIVVLMGKPSNRVMSVLMGFAGGIMLAIAIMELLPEAIELGGMLKSIVGFMLGVALMFGLDHLVPHLHFKNGDSLGNSAANNEMLKTGYLILLGIGVHNVAEGLAIGAGAVASPEMGMVIALAIGLHNIPEGMATAVPLNAGGMRARRLIMLAGVAGLATVLGAWLGVVAFEGNIGLVATALGFAAGAMFYIVGDELIPHARAYHHYWANFGLVGGFVLGVLM